jgi:hypothetical protein
MATLNMKNFPDGAVTETPRVLMALEGLGKDVWQKALEGKDAADYIAEERDSWS